MMEIVAAVFLPMPRVIPPLQIPLPPTVSATMVE